MEEKEFEDTIGVIRIRNSRKDIQLQHKVQKDEYRATRSPLKPRVNLCAQEGYPVPAPLVRLVLLLDIKMLLECGLHINVVKFPS